MELSGVMGVNIVRFWGMVADVSKDVNGLWARFSNVLSESGDDEEHAKFYLGWAEKFAVWLQGVPLRERSLGDIRCFVYELRASGIEDWRVDQAR